MAKRVFTLLLALTLLATCALAYTAEQNHTADALYELGLFKGRTEGGFKVEAGGKEYTAARILIATGSSAVVPPIPGVRENLGDFVVTNREVLELPESPKEFVVIGGGGFFQVRQTCPTCGGEGSVIEKPCKKCRGLGHVTAPQHIALKIPAGVDSGSRLRLAGKGGGGLRGGENGDLYVLLSVRDSEIFERDGLDLYVNVPVSPVTAALGGEVAVPTPEGEARLKIPAGTPNGKVFRLRGKGVVSLRGGAPGDLDARIVFEVPANLDRRQRELLEEFAKISRESTYPEAQSFANRSRVFYAHRDKLRK